MPHTAYCTPPSAHMLTLSPSDSIPLSAAKTLRALTTTWAAAAMLPLPILMTTDPATNGGASCLYLGLASGWLATEIHLFGKAPPSRRARRAALLATCAAVAANVALFILFAAAAGVQTNFPFPLMATLSAIPAVGMVPWLMRRVHDRFAALLLAAILVLATKLAACIVARIVYGPDYIAQGYVSADWRAARLMISLFWIQSTSLSLILLLADSISCKPTPSATAPA